MVLRSDSRHVKKDLKGSASNERDCSLTVDMYPCFIEYQNANKTIVEAIPSLTSTLLAFFSVRLDPLLK